MKIIVGLGNPGKKYENTRHNAGFLVLDKVCEKLKISFDKEKYDALYTIVGRGENKIIFVKPLTYMNNSGQAVKPLMKYYGLGVEDLIVVHDDLDLPVGKLRLRKQGSCGGQNGMRSIIDLLGSSEIKRIRVGISNDKSIDTADYVLGKFSKEEKKIFDEAVDRASDAIIYSLENDFEMVMNKYNG